MESCSAGGESGTAGRGSVCPKPGRKKLAGETLWEPLIPPQPAASNGTAKTTSQTSFRFQFTLPDYTWECSEGNN
jgi:hypothetical protein